MQIDGKRIVLTGAASGIGRALLAQLVTYNVEIIAADRDAPRLSDSVSAPNGVRGTLQAFVCDVSSQKGTDELFDHALAVLGGIDIFIANAGFAYYERMTDANWDRIERIYATNVFSPIYSAQRMQVLNPDKPYLTVMTASAMAHWALPGYTLYGSTKSALDRFAEGYRFEMPPNGRLMLVYPIGTRTRFFETASAPQSVPTQSSATVAKAIIKGIERDRKSVYPSSTWILVQIANHIFPIFKPLVQWINWRVFESTK